MNRVLLIAFTMIGTIATMAGIAYAWPGLVVHSTNPILIRSGPLMAPLLATSIAMVMARSALKSPAFPPLAYGVIFGTFTNAMILIGGELTRLHPYFKTAAWPVAALPYIDSFALTGIGLSMMMAGIIYLILKNQRAPTKRGRLSPKRSFHAYHGDAEWMDLARAAKLFPPGEQEAIRRAGGSDRSERAARWVKAHTPPPLSYSEELDTLLGNVRESAAHLEKYGELAQELFLVPAKRPARWAGAVIGASKSLPQASNVVANAAAQAISGRNIRNAEKYILSGGKPGANRDEISRRIVRAVLQNQGIAVGQ